jgi:hypothetical protein
MKQEPTNINAEYRIVTAEELAAERNLLSPAERAALEALPQGPADETPAKVAASLDHTYQVIVGNIGTVYSGNDVVQAQRDYDDYVSQSQTGYGRAAGESVTLMIDDKPTREYAPSE